MDKRHVVWGTNRRKDKMGTELVNFGFTLRYEDMAKLSHRAALDDVAASVVVRRALWQYLDPNQSDKE